MGELIFFPLLCMGSAQPDYPILSLTRSESYVIHISGITSSTLPRALSCFQQKTQKNLIYTKTFQYLTKLHQNVKLKHKYKIKSNILVIQLFPFSKYTISSPAKYTISCTKLVKEYHSITIATGQDS